MYWLKLLTVCHHPGISFEQRHCDSGDIVFLFVICLMGYVNLWVDVPHGESPPCYVWWPLVY